jgi:hypothetical protein
LNPISDEFNEDFTFLVQNVETTKEDGSPYTYGDKSIIIQIYKYKRLFDMTIKTESNIAEANHVVAEYGMIFGIAAPSFAGILIPLNVLRMVVLIPTKFPPSIAKILKVFVKFDETDPISKLKPNAFHSKQYVEERIF